MRASIVSRSAGLAAVAVMALLVVSMLVPVGAAMSTNTGRSSTPAASATAATAPVASVAPQVHAAPSGSPHPGTIDNYLVAPDGATTEDPAVAYDTVSQEPILNVYQTLVAYNGSSTATFVPQLSTCVPGTSDCNALYGSSLVVNNNIGQPEFFTYPIDPNAHFYDPATGTSWSVYPSDVMFSLARTESFSEAAGIGATPGWIQTQALTQYGNSSWDGGLHYPFNNTPQGILSTMLINDSTYCPALALAQAGCITFDAFGGGVDWPFFNQLVADNLGASVVPCGWFTAQGAGLPGFTGSSAPSGDGPCLLPGGATSTSDASFQAYLTNTNPMAWDAVQLLTLNKPAIQPNVQFNMVGSGPYYLVQISKSTGYVVQASPSYSAPTGCAGLPGCEPLPGAYPGTVNVYWETSDQVGIQEYQAGQADLAGIETVHTATLIQLEQAGKINLLSQATMSIFFLPFNLNFNVAGAQALDTAGTVNIPSTFYSSIAVRNFLVNAYPYATIQSTINTVDGIQFGIPYGGAIPHYMGNYYPGNISWPAGDPVANPTVVGSAAWWWQQANTPTSPYYDAQLAACTAATPCTFPITGQLGAPNLDQQISNFISEITSLSGGALVPHSYDLSFSDLLTYGFPAPTTGPMGLWNLAWAPDYPDPTDYVGPLLFNSTYGYSDAVPWQMAQPQFNAPSCPHQTDSWADLVYWANLGQIPNACQGVAYSTMIYWMTLAAPLPVGDQRTLDYNVAEHILNELALYVYQEQSAGVESYATWLDPATLNTNVMIGGGGANTYYTVGYATAQSTIAVGETGLAPGATWSATVGGVTQSGTSSALSFSLPPRTSTYYIGAVNGYGVNIANGTVTGTAGNTTTLSVVFTQFTGAMVPLTFSQSGMASTGSNNWTLVVTGVGAMNTADTSLTFNVPAGTYNYAAVGALGYKPITPSGTITVSASGAGVVVPFAPTLGQAVAYPVVVTESGLVAGTSWSASMTASLLGAPTVTQTSTASSITFYETNGTYAYAWATVTGYSSSGPVASPINVTGPPAGPSLVVVPIVYTAIVTPGTLSITLVAGGPSSATLYINGVSTATLNSGQPYTSGPLVVGTYSISVVASGYYTYYNNATVLGGSQTPVPVSMISTSSGSSSSGISNTAWALIGVFVVLTVIFLITTVYYMRRAKPPATPPPSWSSGSSGTQGGNMPPPSK